MDNNQFQLLIGSINALQVQVEKLDGKLDSVNVETARQGVKIAQLEQTTSHQKTFISSILATVVAGALAAWAVPTLTEKTSNNTSFERDVLSQVITQAN